MNIFSYLSQLVEKSIINNGIQLDDESFERLDNELSLIEEENLSYYFILNNKISTISKKHSLPFMPEYGVVSAWFVNYCLGISKINSLYRSSRVQRFYRPSIENIAALFTPIPEQYQELMINELKQEVERDDNLNYYSKLHLEAFSEAIADISKKPLFYYMVL